MILMLQNAVFAVLFLAAMYLVGTLMLRVVGWKQTSIGAIAWGFITVMGVFQLIAYPLFLAKASFTMLLIAFGAVMLLLIGTSLFVCIRHRIWKHVGEELIQLWTGFRKTPLPILLLGFMILLFLYYGVFYTHLTHDDSYYMPRAMEVLTHNSLGVSHSVGWFGWEVEGFPKTTDVSTLEFFKALLSYLSGIPVTVLTRNGFQIALILISLASIWTFADVFAQEKKHAFSIKAYALILWIAILLLDLNQESSGQWIANKLWQGKSMLPSIVFSMLFAACGCIIQHIESFKKQEWISVCLLLLAGMSVSIVGIFLTPILYFLIGVSFLLVTKFRYFKRIAPCAIAAAVPTVLTIGISYYNVVSENSRYFSIAEQNRTWLEELLYSTNKYVFVLFLVCAVYVFFKGTDLERALFVVMPLLHFMTFLNPLFRTIVSTYITTRPVYFRLFWLLPVLLLPVFWIPNVLLEKLDPHRLQTGLVLVCFSMSLYVGGQWSRGGDDGMEALIPATKHARARTNIYRMESDSFEMCLAIDADWKEDARPLILFYDNDYRQNEIRQYTDRFNLACGMRKEQVAYLTENIPGTNIRSCDFYEIYQTIEDGAYLHDMLTRLGINYVCFYDEPACKNPEACGFTPLNQNNRTLWRVDTIAEK